MPQVQTVDLSPTPSTNPLVSTIAAFTKRDRENRIQKQETDALREIYGKYQNEGRNIEDAIIGIQTNPNLSPSTRVSAINQALEMKKLNTQLQSNALKEQEHAENRRLAQQKAINLAEGKAAKEAKTTQEKADTKTQTENSVYELYKSIMPDDEARRLSKVDSIETARFKVNQFNAKNKPSSKSTKSNEEKATPFKSGLEVLNRMKEIRKNGNLGIASRITGLLNPDVRRDRGEYERLGKSLISLSSNIPIRNRQEFEVLSNDLFDPNITDAEAEGIIEAMERILTNNIKQYSISEQGSAISPESGRPPLSSFKR